ncbi:hypothetical protein M2650_15240 [Luteimonas sp. SX5]|uniref:Lipoprotein n=1 Tax=Luteimonas galliterrae TaxID=2940486 RepID=A0ABT0MM83_9GAMM|nr:hypothetical protein [Luteimonas galliterrae]MCL1635977.1 hypothetical protein [Luteimonas galliterrae]
MEFKKAIAPLALGMALALGGCASNIPLNYAPSSVMSAEGALTVTDFRYLPAISGKVKPNQIRNTAIGNAYFDQNVDVFFKDAVFKELRFVGMKLNDPNKVLGGEIDEFLIDDLGYSVDWTLRVKYVVTEAGTGKVMYESTKTTQRKTSKFANVFGALNETIKLNVEEAMKDPQFMAAVK